MIQNPSDTQSISQFRHNLQSKVTLAKTVSPSVSESKFEVFFLGSASDLEDIVDKVAENNPGLGGFYQVDIRE